MISKDPWYRFEDVDDDGRQYLVRIEIAHMDTVDIRQDSTGEVIVTAKQTPVAEQETPAPAVDAGNGKYRLEPEGDMFRLYATRDIRGGVLGGTQGGLVGGPDVLSKSGRCWVSYGSTVGANCKVKDDAAVLAGCDIRGWATISGSATLSRTKVTGEAVYVSGSMDITDSYLDSGSHGELQIRGYGYIYDSLIEVPAESLTISGCNIKEAHIRNSYELVVTHHNNWGWLSAYRNKGGGLQFTIGCQTMHGVEELKHAAHDSDVHLLELEMLDHFLAMVAVAQRGWQDYVAPTPAPVEPAVNPFPDLAQRARDAVWAMNPSPAVRPAAMDQYGTEL
jgi:hypothetical protein